MSAVLKSGFSPLELLKAPGETQVEICDLAGGGQSLPAASSSRPVTSAIVSSGGFLVAALRNCRDKVLRTLSAFQVDCEQTSCKGHITLHFDACE